jgi:uncharacterized protein YqgC (DUF456 family)
MALRSLLVRLVCVVVTVMVLLPALPSVGEMFSQLALHDAFQSADTLNVTSVFWLTTG